MLPPFTGRIEHYNNDDLTGYVHWLNPGQGVTLEMLEYHRSCIVNPILANPALDPRKFDYLDLAGWKQFVLSDYAAGHGVKLEGDEKRWVYWFTSNRTLKGPERSGRNAKCPW